MSTGFVHSEQLLSDLLGRSRDDLKKARKAVLIEDVDWAIVRSEVRLTKKAAEQLLVLLGVDLPKKVKPGSAGFSVSDVLSMSERRGAHIVKKECAVGEWLGPQDQVLVVDSLTRNSKILRATFLDDSLAPKGKQYLCDRLTKDGKPWVRVRVRNNVKFRKGMKMDCRHVQADLWEFVGRGPRSKGRW